MTCFDSVFQLFLLGDPPQKLTVSLDWGDDTEEIRLPKIPGSYDEFLKSVEDIGALSSEVFRRKGTKLYSLECELRVKEGDKKHRLVLRSAKAYESELPAIKAGNRLTG